MLLIYVSSSADVVELVDTLDLGSSAVRCGSSSLPIRTNLKVFTFEKFGSFMLTEFFCFTILHKPIS